MALKPFLLAVLAASLAAHLQGCGSKDKKDDKAPSMTQTCGDGCNVILSCTDDSKVESKVENCKSSSTEEVDSGMPKDFKDLASCKAYLEGRASDWQTNRLRICPSLQGSDWTPEGQKKEDDDTKDLPMEVTWTCPGGCSIRYWCLQDGLQYTEAKGCSTTEPFQPHALGDISSCKKQIQKKKQFFEEHQEQACAVYSPTTLAIDSVGLGAEFSTEKAFYMLLGGAIVTVAYLVARAVLATRSAAREARVAKLALTAAASAEAEMGRVTSTNQ